MPAPPASAAPIETIPIDVAARLLMVSPDRIRQLIRGGYIPKPERGRTTIVGAVQGYLRFMQEDRQTEGQKAAGNRLSEARADYIEARTEARRAGLMPATDARAAMDELVEIVRDEFAGWPARSSVSDPARLAEAIAASMGRVDKARACADRIIAGEAAEFFGSDAE